MPAASCTFPICTYVHVYKECGGGQREGGECIRLLYHLSIQGALFVQATIEAGLIPPLINILQKVSVGGSVWCKYICTYCQKLSQTKFISPLLLLVSLSSINSLNTLTKLKCLWHSTYVLVIPHSRVVSTNIYPIAILRSSPLAIAIPLQ